MPPKRKSLPAGFDLSQIFPEIKKLKGNSDDDDELPTLIKFKHKEEIQNSTLKNEKTKILEIPNYEYKSDIELYFDEIYKVILKFLKI